MARALSDLWRHPNPDALAATWRACRSPAGERWSLAAFCGPCRLGTICPWHSTLHQPQPAVRFSKRAKLAKHQPLPNSSAQLVFCRHQTSLPSLAYSQVQPGHWVWGAWSQHWRAPAEWCWWAQKGAVTQIKKVSVIKKVTQNCHRAVARGNHWAEPYSGSLGGPRGDGQGEKVAPWEVAARRSSWARRLLQCAKPSPLQPSC